MANEIQGFSDMQETLRLFRITPLEIAAIQAFSAEAKKTLESFITEYYKWIADVDEFKLLFSRTGLIEQVKEVHVEYWKKLFQCQINEDYIQSRFSMGEIYSKINLPVSSWVASLSFSLDWWIAKINSITPAVKDSSFLISSLGKFLLLDSAIILAFYTKSSNDIIEQQSRDLMELSIPTIQLWEDILVLPILGVLDSRRAQDMTEVMLNKILETGSRSIIIDITGVPTVDSSVANHLIKITKATKLMGCECILTGIGPEIAQTLVHLGINLDTVQTSANLKSALQMVLVKAGYQIKLVRQE